MTDDGSRINIVFVLLYHPGTSTEFGTRKGHDWNIYRCKSNFSTIIRDNAKNVKLQNALILFDCAFKVSYILSGSFQQLLRFDK